MSPAISWKTERFLNKLTILAMKLSVRETKGLLLDAYDQKGRSKRSLKQGGRDCPIFQKNLEKMLSI